MECSNSDCAASFDQDEAVPIRGTNRYSNRERIIAHECPGCGQTLPMQFTREINTELCGCSALVDMAEGGEVCSECGEKYPLRGMEGGIKQAWAIPASEDMRLDRSDAQEYWEDKPSRLKA